MRRAFIDLDGTLYNGFVTLDFVLWLARRGSGRSKYTHTLSLIEEGPSRSLSTRKDREDSHGTGSVTMLSYAQWADALSDSLAELFASFEHGELEAEVTIFMTDASQQLYGYSRGLCSVLAGAGFEVTILTGAHQFVAQKLGSYLGVDEERIVGCRQNQDANGHYLNSYTPGFTSMPAEKLPWAATSGYERHKSIALGDSSSDLELLAAMDKRVFFTSEVHSEAAKVASSMGALVLDRDVLNDNEILEAVSLLIEDHS